MASDFLGQGWRHPVGFDPAGGGIATSEREQNIRQSILVILGTRPGERVMCPEFGCRVQELLFAPHTQATASLVAHHVRAALSRWEPRIDVTDVQTQAQAQGATRVVVQYRIRSTAELQQLDLVLTG